MVPGEQADLLELVLDAEGFEHEDHRAEGRAELVSVQGDGHGVGGALN